VLDELGLERYCCRAIFMGHVDLIDTVTEFKKF
jgi:DNA-directed RNA polymerase subunit N (RpoN/RPB10)